MVKKVALLVNLGSPRNCDVKSVREYLDEFLMDKYVLDYPKIIRWLLVKFIILRFRPKRTSEAYKSIWTENGSPLISISGDVQNKLRNISTIPIYISMRYGDPSIGSTIQTIRMTHNHVDTLHVVPLYPHYAMSTTKTVSDRIKEVINEIDWDVRIHIEKPFYSNEKYINALSCSIESSWSNNYEYLLFSYHGLPVRHLRKCDPTGKHCYFHQDCCNVESVAHNYCYRHQVYETTKLVAKKLHLQESRYSVSFQSRLLSDPWLEPFTDLEIKRLAKSGIRRLAIVCPAFVSDNLETLEEIAIAGKEIFLENGGERCDLIPCMNDDDRWIDVLSDLIK